VAIDAAALTAVALPRARVGAMVGARPEAVPVREGAAMEPATEDRWAVPWGEAEAEASSVAPSRTRRRMPARRWQSRQT
jgi:hypothetical protein